MGAWRPKHVEWLCRNKTCTVLHQVGVSFDLYYDARKHKMEIFTFLLLTVSTRIYTHEVDLANGPLHCTRTPLPFSLKIITEYPSSASTMMVSFCYGFCFTSTIIFSSPFLVSLHDTSHCLSFTETANVFCYLNSKQIWMKGKSIANRWASF